MPGPKHDAGVGRRLGLPMLPTELPQVLHDSSIPRADDQSAPRRVAFRSGAPGMTEQAVTDEPASKRPRQGQKPEEWPQENEHSDVPNGQPEEPCPEF